MSRFKVGNKVKIIGGYAEQNKRIGNGVITEIEKSEPDWNRYTFENGYHNSYQDCHLELVDDTKFKVGETLKQIKWVHPPEDPIVKVTRIEGNMIWHVHRGETEENNSSENHFVKTDEKFEEEESMGKYKFKVGDEVKIIGCYDDFYKRYIGGTGVIGRCKYDEPSGYNFYRLEGKRLDEGWDYREDDLELVKPKLAVGDEVKFKGSIAGGGVPEYYTGINGIPAEKIQHGSTILHKDYSTEFAKIVDKHNEYYIVEYKDYYGKKVRLGFKEEVLELVTKRAEFKKGDKVRILLKEPKTEDCSCSSKSTSKCPFYNQIGKIHNIEENRIHVIGMKNLNDGSTGCSAFTAEDLELIVELKVKDKVRISIPRSEGGWEFDGKEGVIKKINEKNEYPITVRFDNDENVFKKEEVEKR